MLYFIPQCIAQQHFKVISASYIKINAPIQSGGVTRGYELKLVPIKKCTPTFSKIYGGKNLLENKVITPIKKIYNTQDTIQITASIYQSYAAIEKGEKLKEENISNEGILLFYFINKKKYKINTTDIKQLETPLLK